MAFRYDFTQLRTKEQLITFLGLNEASFEYVLSFDPTKQTSSDTAEPYSALEIPAFLQHRIPKKNPLRGDRVVWEPIFTKNAYKALARRLHDFFAQKVVGYPHARTFGFLSGRNIRENAKDHCGHKHLISVDLENFFPSIKITRIRTFLENTGICPAVSELLSRFVTIENALPLGLPTSPTISNAICSALDIELDALADKHSTIYSRYVDDMAFSSNEALPPLNEIKDCVERHQFRIADSKTRRSKLGQAHYVTGLSVSDPKQAHAPRKKRRRLRQELYYAKKYGLEDHFQHLGVNDIDDIQHQVNRIDGMVKFVAYHEPHHSAQLKTAWADILSTSGWRPSFTPKNQHSAPFFIFIDETEIQHPEGRQLLGLAMAVSQHQDQVSFGAREVLDTALSDVWSAGDREAITQNGLHFTHAHEDLRLEFAKKMQTLPFEGYVALGTLPTPAEYETTYIRLLKAMLRRRLIAAESKIACLVFEENDKVRQQAIRDAVAEAHRALRKTNNRGPAICIVKFAGKPNLGLSIPDFLLGFLRRYLLEPREKPSENTPRNTKIFERLRDKYRLILDVDEQIEYGRRRPITPWSANS